MKEKKSIFKKASLILILILFISVIIIININKNETTLSSRALTIFISKDGNDDDDGSKSSPFKTLDRAVQELFAELDTGYTGDVEILLTEGEYSISDSVVLDFSNRNMANTNVVIKPYKNDTVSFTGGAVLDTDSFNIYDKEKNIYYASLENISSLLPSDSYTFYTSPKIYENNELMTLSRYPNNDFITIPSTVNQTTAPYTIPFTDSFISSIKDTANLNIAGYTAHYWQFSSTRIAGINNNSIVINDTIPYGVLGDRSYFLQNSLDLLDIPGEYYIDYYNKLLYLIPSSDISDNSYTVSLLSKPMIELINGSNISLENLTFHNSISKPVTITNSSNVSIKNCTFYDISDDVITITGGSNNIVSGNKIFNVGSGGVIVEGGDRNTLTSCNHIVENNDIYNFALLKRTYNPAIKMTGVGITARNNKVHDSYHTGILFFGNNHTIDGNELYNLATETDDASAIYSGRDWTFRGNKITNNYIHDLKNTYDDYGVWAIYLDDCMSSAYISGNTIENVYGGMFIGGGRDQEITENTFINCTNSIRFDERGVHYNIPQLYENLNKVPYTSAIWNSSYPEIASILTDMPGYPINNKIYNNTLTDCGDFIISNEVRSHGEIYNNIFN